MPVVISSRVDRIKLHLEWDSLPLGFGGSVVWPLDLWRLHEIGYRLELVLWLRWPAAALLVGLWRPTHRRYGLARNDRWRAPR